MLSPDQLCYFLKVSTFKLKTVFKTQFCISWFVHKYICAYVQLKGQVSGPSVSHFSADLFQ